MEKLDVCLVSDFDGVLVNSLPLIDEYVKRIDYKASDEYRKILVDRSNQLHILKQQLEEEQKFNSNEYRAVIEEIEELRRKRYEHYDRKNVVLEEVYPEYRNRIDYNAIYQLENAYDGVIETLIRIKNEKIYDKIIVCSSVNTSVEILYKRKFINKYLENAYFLPVHFFSLPYEDPETNMKNVGRIPADKLVALTEHYFIDIPKSVVVDDTKGVIDSGLKLGFNCFHRKVEDDINEIFINAANDTIDNVHGGKIKKLSL